MAKLKSGHVVKDLTEEENENLHRLFPKVEFFRLDPGGWIILDTFVKYADRIREFKMRPTDVMITSFPKCGTIWTCELVWTMLRNNNFDNEFKDKSLMFRVPSLTQAHLWVDAKHAIGDAAKTICPDVKPGDDVVLQIAAQSPSPRVLRGHLPLTLMPTNLLDTNKVICIARNPKDVIISFLHFLKLIKHFNFLGNLDDMIDLFVSDSLVEGPFWEFYEEYWNSRHHPNLHWIIFEDLKADTFKEVLRLDKFLGTELGDEKIKEIIEYTSFGQMKKRDPIFGQFKQGQENLLTDSKTGGTFFRKGKAGGWKNELTVAQNEKLDAWIEKHSANSGLRMKY